MRQRFLLLQGTVMIVALLLSPAWRSAIVTNLRHVETSHAILSTNALRAAPGKLWFFPWVLPQSAADQTWEAETYSAEQMWGQAKSAYRQYRQLGGDTTQALRRLKEIAAVRGWCLTQRQPLLELAETLVHKAKAYEVLGDACAANNQFSIAIDAYRRAFDLSVDPIVSSKLAWLLFQRAQVSKAETSKSRLADFAEVVHVLKAVSLPTDDTRNYYLLAWSYWQLNQFDDALAMYEACLDTSHKKDRYAFACALNLGYAYSAWLPADRWDLPKAALYYRQAEMLAFDDASRLEAQQAQQLLEGRN